MHRDINRRTSFPIVQRAAEKSVHAGDDRPRLRVAGEELIEQKSTQRPGSESVRSNSMGSTNRAEELREPDVFGEVALLLRSIRLMKNQPTNDTAQPALQRDPDDWKTGDEPMTDAQRSYLETLCRETGEEFDDALTKAEASKRIDELRARSPRLSDQ